jgi:hypothetical protein
MTDRIPFSNGTEGQAWTAVWCEHCVHDHDISHDPDGPGPGCTMLVEAMVGGDDWQWPEAWTAEPPSLGFNLPSLMLCGMFEPCHKGTCDGDPHAETRVELVARVEAAWAEDRKAGAA